MSEDLVLCHDFNVSLVTATAELLVVILAATLPLPQRRAADCVRPELVTTEG